MDTDKSLFLAGIKVMGEILMDFSRQIFFMHPKPFVESWNAFGWKGPQRPFHSKLPAMEEVK